MGTVFNKSARPDSADTTINYDIKCACGATILYTGYCPYGHGVLRCYCGTPLSKGECPHGHDKQKSKCSYCGSYLQYDKCPHGHDGRHCLCGVALCNGVCPKCTPSQTSYMNTQD